MKNVSICLVAALFCSLCSIEASGQENVRTLTAQIKDENGEPLIGANIYDFSTKNGTISDFDGKFSLKINDSSRLKLSFIGYNDKIISGKELKQGQVFILGSRTNLIDEIVVVGYGTQKKVNLTGAVASISAKDIADKPVTNIVEALQGTSPGLVIQQTNSSPGSRLFINVRGLNTMNDNSPLVLIDGIIGDIQSVNSSDVESISVLKDASSTAIYGSRASNGVLLITTKYGTASKNEISYEMKYGWQSPTCLPEIVDSWVYAEMRNEALMNSGLASAFTPEQIAYYRNGGPNVKWIEEIYKKKSPQQSHNMSFSGGNNKTTFLLSLGYMDQNSMFKGPDYGMQRYNARLNLSHKASKNITLTSTISYIRNEVKEHAYWTEWIIEQATRMPSIYPIKNDKGDYTYPSGSNSNALARLEKGGYRKLSNDDISGTLNVELKIWDGLKLRGMVGGQLYNNWTHENRNQLMIQHLEIQRTE